MKANHHAKMKHHMEMAEKAHEKGLKHHEKAREHMEKMKMEKMGKEHKRGKK